MKRSSGNNIPKPGDLLEGDFWPEPVRVLTVQPLGSNIKIEAVGTKTQQFYPFTLNEEKLGHVRTVVETGRDFGGRGKAFFLAMEAHRIRYAHQFLWGSNVLSFERVFDCEALPMVWDYGEVNPLSETRGSWDLESINRVFLYLTQINFSLPVTMPHGITLLQTDRGPKQRNDSELGGEQ